MIHPNILFYKWLIGNSFAFLVVYIAWLQGWIELIVESDASYLSLVMGVIFMIFWLFSSYHVVQLNRETGRFLDHSSSGIAAEYFIKLREKIRNYAGVPVDQTLLATMLRARMMLPIQIIQFVANTLILLGLIGTVVGFVIAVSGLGDAIAGGDNAERIKDVLGQIVNGMGIALFTTLVGSVLGGLWLQIHYQMLQNAVTALMVRIVEHAEVALIPAFATGSKSAQGEVGAGIGPAGADAAS